LQCPVLWNFALKIVDVAEKQLVDSENITSCLPDQLDRRASDDHASKPEVRSDPEDKEVCLYLVNGFQNAIDRFTFRKGRMQMNGMALCLLLRIIKKPSA